MNEVEKKVKIGLWRQRIGYGSSDFACNLIWQMISLYLLYFYTNVMHLNAGAVSVMILVTKVIDGISDLIVGFLIDKTNTKWGKSRPWILFGAIPFGVAAVVAFSVPNIGQTGMLIYAYISYPCKNDIKAKSDGWRKLCTYGWSFDHFLRWYKCSCSSCRCSDRSSRIRTESKYALCNAA